MIVQTPTPALKSARPGNGRGALPWTALLVCVGAALVSGWLTLSQMQRFHHADSLIPALLSLYRWTWFYWGQNRYGMLTALLAMPIQHPLYNLLFQNWLVSFCGLMVFPLTHAYLAGWRAAPLSGLLAATVFLLAGPEQFHADYLLVNQPYAVSSCLGWLGLMALEASSDRRRTLRLALGAVLLFLGFWVSLGAVFLVFPLYAAKRWVGGGHPALDGKSFFVGGFILAAEEVDVVGADQSYAQVGG